MNDQTTDKYRTNSKKLNPELTYEIVHMESDDLDNEEEDKGFVRYSLNFL